MNTRKLITALTVLILIFGAMPLAAQNSPAGGLASGNVINRDVDTYMMVNFAPFLNYDKFFTFFQTSMYGTLSAAGLPGFQAGFATKALGGFMNFYLNTSGVDVDNTVLDTVKGSGALETTDKSGRFNMQFDTIYGQADLGTFKLGLNFSDIGKDETYTQTSLTDYTKTLTRYGFITPSLSYARNFIHSDFSMLLASATVSFRIPLNYGKTITETRTGGVTKTTTTALADSLASAGSSPGYPYNASNRMEIVPQMWYFFKPKLEPMVVISHIYLINTFVMMFYPEQTKTIESTAIADDGYIKRHHSYVGNTLFGYYNRQYVITSRFSVAWRINVSMGFYFDKKGYTYDKPLGGAEAVIMEKDTELYLTATIAPRLAFSAQLVPGTLVLNGAVVLNQLGPMNSTGWQYYRNKTVNDSTDVTTVKNRHLFNGINAVFDLGAAWNLSPYLILEGGVEINTGGSSNPLSSVTLGIVYKR